MTSSMGSPEFRRTIGVVCHRAGMPGSGLTDAFVAGITRECATHKVGHVFGYFQRPSEFREFVNGAVLAMVEGFIVGGVFHKELVADMVELQQEGYPIVTTYNHPVHRALVNIGADQVGIGRTATEHLLERGCRAIVHHHSSEARFVGYRQALRARGIGVKPEWVYDPEDHAHTLTAMGGEQLVRRYLDDGIPFDGIVGTSDHQAMGTIRALLRAGLRVPEDVKVIGVDNSPLCDAAYITVSSISDDTLLRGRLAVRALLDRIRGRAVKSLALEPVLVARESTASTPDPPPSA